ncbi:hypothetical protein PR048_021792 [Dryococelus australis]|uniref:Uncharacterized protein n=1 Tax=Dryococelus australis TaxID=614101 RepID=A0ABQ9GZ75_9NEOP|nr:hypothetical protein PR048_021792 [Dryococelus australis]
MQVWPDLLLPKTFKIFNLADNDIVNIVLENLVPNFRAFCSFSPIPSMLEELISFAVEVQGRVAAEKEFQNIYSSSSKELRVLRDSIEQIRNEHVVNHHCGNCRSKSVSDVMLWVMSKQHVLVQEMNVGQGFMRCCRS